MTVSTPVMPGIYPNFSFCIIKVLLAIVVLQTDIFPSQILNITLLTESGVELRSYSTVLFKMRELEFVVIGRA
jgi:hypothetical protein